MLAVNCEEDKREVLINKTDFCPTPLPPHVFPNPEFPCGTKDPSDDHQNILHQLRREHPGMCASMNMCSLPTTSFPLTQFSLILFL